MEMPDARKLELCREDIWANKGGCDGCLFRRTDATDATCSVVYALMYRLRLKNLITSGIEGKVPNEGCFKGITPEDVRMMM